MNSSVYKTLQKAFIDIRFLYSDGCFDAERLNQVLADIKLARPALQADSQNNLLYCIDTLLEIIEEGDREKIFDFADAIHNMPEIYLGKRSPASFQYDIDAFRKKYGISYFPFGSP